MKIEVTEQKFVMSAYFVTLLCLLLTVVDNVPLMGVLLRVKYLYIMCIIIFCLRDGILIWNRRFAVVFGLLVVHTILYGKVFTNPRIITATSTIFTDLITTYVIVFFTVIYVYKNDLLLLFLEYSFWALCIMIMWAAVTHPSNFVNPIYFINIFSRMGRFRAPFGMGDVNFCGNYCLYQLILLIILMVEWRKQEKKPHVLYLCAALFVSMVSMAMLLSTASRSAILSLIIFAGLAVVQLYWRQIKPIAIRLLPIILIVVVLAMMYFSASGKLQEMWSNSNREGNFDINYPIFLRHGNLMHGMGYADNSAYLQQIYGYETTAQDVYYLYITFSTGIVGSILIYGQMLYLLWLTLRYYKTDGRIWALSLYAMMLFYSIWQVNYMNARYYTGIIHMSILFIFSLKIREEKDTKWIKLKR